MAQEAPKPEAKITHLKEKVSRRSRKKLIEETQTEVVMAISQKPYRGEKMTDTIRKDHKFDPRQRTHAGRAL